MILLSKILAATGSTISIGFGIWHFFVPKIWSWYSFMDPAAEELVTAVRAINIFFSLCLVLFGFINILFVNSSHSNRFSIIVMLSATAILWVTRVILQLIYPQGSMNPLIQYGMLSTFIFVFLCFMVSLIITVNYRS